MSTPTPPASIRATIADLPQPIAAVFADPPSGRRSIVDAGLRWSVLEWGDPDDPPLLLLHGVTASAQTWWRIGAALAASGLRVIAPDLPGHGETGQWTGHHRFRDNARDIAALVRAVIGTDARLTVVGHSWGAMTAAALPAAGLVPARIVLLDPPAVSAPAMAVMVDDPSNRRYAGIDEARLEIRRANPTWSDGDVEAKAEALVQLDEAAARAVLLDNGDWDGGLADLADPAARDVPLWIVRGEEPTGGLIPDEAVPGLAARAGADRVLTIADGPHSPQRTHPEATVVALLRALA